MVFKPGQSGNPTGRPKGVSLTSAILRVLTEEDADKLVKALIKRAKKDTRAFEQLIERTDGKVPTQIGGITDDDGNERPIPLRIIAAEPDAGSTPKRQAAPVRPRSK
jgi:hypothetical protein